MKTRRRKTDRQKMIKKLDDLFRQIILRRDKYLCQYALVSRGDPRVGSEVHHIFSRRHLNTRWDLVNGITLTRGHGIWRNGPHSDPELFREFLITKWFRSEQKYQHLMARAYTKAHFKTGDLKAVELFLLSQLPLVDRRED